jgi:hypothetical protein
MFSYYGSYLNDKSSEQVFFHYDARSNKVETLSHPLSGANESSKDIIRRLMQPCEKSYCQNKNWLGLDQNKTFDELFEHLLDNGKFEKAPEFLRKRRTVDYDYRYGNSDSIDYLLIKVYWKIEAQLYGDTPYDKDYNAHNLFDKLQGRSYQELFNLIFKKLSMSTMVFNEVDYNPTKSFQNAEALFGLLNNDLFFMINKDIKPLNI